MDTFNILGKILFDLGLDILINLVDNDAWGLALGLIQTLNIHDLPCNAEYFLLSAEIYLANKKAVKACDLLKCEFIFRDQLFFFILTYINNNVCMLQKILIMSIKTLINILNIKFFNSCVNIISF